MKMIPPVIRPDTTSTAEKRLFEMLALLDLGDDYRCLHSVDLPSHDYKVCGEIDFIVASRRGVYILEVKGGRVSCQNGIWIFVDKYDNANRKSEGPFHQARSAMFALEKRLRERPEPILLNDLVLGFGVILADVKFDLNGMEWDPAVLLDSRAFSINGLQAYLKGLEKYWHSKVHKPSAGSDAAVAGLVRALRPDFERFPPLHVQVNLVEARLTALTDSQYERLEIVEENDRIIVSGGAGTGKTFLAVNLAQRNAWKGKRVLFTCFSQALAAFVASKSTSPKVDVVAITDLMKTIIRRAGLGPLENANPSRPDDPWIKETLLPAFAKAAAALPAEEKYDVLILDEAQDVLSLDYILAFGSLLKGGLEKGVWRIFLDPLNQSVLWGKMDTEAIGLLHSFGATTASLKVNCRNTDEIVLQTKLLTGADMGTRSVGPGPAVEQVYYANPVEAAALLEQQLEKLVDKNEVDPSEITILSPKPFSASCASLLSDRWRKRAAQSALTSTGPYPDKGFFFSTIAGFKGLENRYIFLVDVDDVDSDPQAQALLYVGMSRARARLWIAFDQKIKMAVRAALERHLPKVLEDTQK